MQIFSTALVTLIIVHIFTLNIAVCQETVEVLTYAQPREIWDEDKLLNFFENLNLSDHENKDHSFGNYINKSEDWLKTRLRRNEHLSIASSYYDLDKAKTSIQQVVLQNSEQIVKWLNNPESTLQRQFIGEFNEAIGHGFSRSNNNSFLNLSRARLVLAKKSDEPRIVSSYPIE